MSNLFHVPTRARCRLAPAPRATESPRHSVRPEVWQLEDRVLPATTPATAGLSPPAIQVPVQAFSLPADALALPFLAAAPQGNAPPVVRFNNPQTGVRQFALVPYDPAFTGGVRLAVADVNGDGVPDLITGAGPGGGSHVRVFDGRTGDQAAGPLGCFLAFEPTFTGGANVAARDVNGDGFADVIVAAGVGGGPRVRVLSGKDGSSLYDFFTTDPALRRGLTVAAADVNRDGLADIITAAGAGGPTEVAAFSGRDLSRLSDFLAFEPDFTCGVSVAAADLTGDGAADIVVGAGVGGGPRVRVFDGRSAAVLKDFLAFDPSLRGGVSVAATDADGDGRPEIVTGAGPGGGSQVRVFDAATLADLNTYAAYSPPFDNTGVVVAGR
jgi:hypothetical protein